MVEAFIYWISPHTPRIIVFENYKIVAFGSYVVLPQPSPKFWATTE